MDHRDFEEGGDASSSALSPVSTGSASFPLLLSFACIKLTLLWIVVQLLLRYILGRLSGSKKYSSSSSSSSRNRKKTSTGEFLGLRPIELEWRHADEQLPLHRWHEAREDDEDDDDEDEEDEEDNEQETDGNTSTVPRTNLRQSPFSIQLTSNFPSIFTLPFRLFRISSSRNSAVNTSTWAFRVLDLLARASVLVTTAIMLFVIGSLLRAAMTIVWRRASGIVQDGSSEGGLQILMPGLSFPLTHLPVILITTLLSQFIHELFGHALIGGIASLTAPSKSTSLRSTKNRLLLPQKIGIFLSFPGIFAVAYVVFPPLHILKRTYHLRTFQLAQMLAGGIFANLVSLLAILAIFGSPTQLTAVQFFPSRAAVLLGIGPGAPAHMSSFSIPSLSLGKYLRALMFSADPLSAYAPVASSDGPRGLRVAMVDSSAPSALATSLRTGDILIAVDDLQLTGQPFERLDLWVKALAPDTQLNGTQKAPQGGWCFDKADWESLPLCGPESTLTSDPLTCFLPPKDHQARGRPVDPVALSEGKVGNFAGTRCEVDDASGCQSTKFDGRDGLCIIPDPSAHLVRLTLLSANDGPATTTLFLQISRQALLATLTLSPFIPRAPLRALLPSTVTDGWLMLVELFTCYFLLVSVSIIVINCLPLPGLDGNQMLEVFLDVLSEKRRRRMLSGDVESRAPPRPTLSPVLRRLILRIVQAILVASLIIIIVHNVF